MAGGRPKKGTRRMDAAIDHFTRMGYAKAHVRTVVNKLLTQVYGSEGWAFLEEDCYRVVQDVLFEEEEQQRQLQLQAEGEGEEVEEAAQQLEEAIDEAQVENMSVMEVHHEVPTAAVSGFEEEEAVLPLSAAVHHEVPAAAVSGFEEEEAVLPLPAAARTVCTRPPCYGWISESDSDSELDCDPIQHVVKILRAGEESPCKRNRQSRWDADIKRPQ